MGVTVKPSRFKMSPEKQETLLKMSILSVAAVLSFATRLFSVLRFESVIHEFDPYFNYRTTKFLAEEGFYKFHNWFDDRAWYPLGRIIGGTIYPGLMVTSASLYHFLSFLNISIDIRNVCVFLAPFFSSLTTIVTYLLTKELKDSSAGLVAAAMISIVPGYISRSVAGSYDNEGIAIFCMLLTYYMWIKAVKTGSIFWSAFSALAYFYMVSSWGGYVFLINLIPLHVLTLMLTGRFSHRIYIAYSTLYCVGTILSMQISFVGFQPIQSSEHMLAFGVFGLCQIYSFVNYIKSKISGEDFQILFKALVVILAGAVAAAAGIATFTGKISPWTGRFYSLLDPSYAKNHIPIIASVSEHQPTSWSSFYFDLQILVFLFPAGLYFCFSKLTDANIFLVLYGVTSIYFAGVMVRLMLVLAPVMCILSGIAVSAMLTTYMKQLDPTKVTEKKSKKIENNYIMKKQMTVLLCPLCSQPRFNNLESLRVSLVNAATQSISCPICDDILMGLDKLTIHLFAHTLNQNKETDQRPSLELKTTKSVEESCLVTNSQVVEHSSPGVKVAERSGYEENDKFFSEIGSSLAGDATQVQDPETKDDNLCTVNMEDLGFLTSWESIVKPKQNQREVDNQNLQENNNKQENNELSEYMSDLLNKKLPILNFSYEPDTTVEMKETVEKDSGYDKKPLKCGICCFFFPNQVILSLHEELVHSKVKASEKKGEIFDSCKNEQEEKETSSDMNREKYEYLPELLNNNQNLEDMPHKYDGQFTIGDGANTNALELNGEETTLPRYDCHLCSKSFKMKGSLLVHFRVAHFSLNSSDSLQILGDISSTEDRNHLCPICSKTFKKEQHLAQHIKTHEGKQWQCETCSKHFTTKYFLKKHQRLHTGEMPYSCLTCKKTFTFQQSYHKHLLYHSDEKPHQCTQCGRSFKELSTLHNHQRIHSGEKPFACETCGKCFRQRVSYIVHQRIHTGVLPYQCTACKKKFRYKVSQRSHKCTAQPPGIVIRQPDIVQKLLENKQILQQNPG